eukprot:8689363-Pyramimonas_sp.AAC.1
MCLAQLARKQRRIGVASCDGTARSTLLTRARATAQIQIRRRQRMSASLKMKSGAAGAGKSERCDGRLRPGLAAIIFGSRLS